MTVKPAGEEEHTYVIGLYDDLLGKVLKKVLEDIDNNPPKLGDFLKMFELRLKATPPSTRHKKFWQMLEEIRHNTLPSQKRPVPDAQKTGKKDKTK